MERTTPRVALVSGGNRGIGLEICRGLAERGVGVALGSRDPDAGEEAAARLREAGGKVKVVQLDVTDPRSVSAAARHLGEVGWSVDILVNNAGVYTEGSPLEVQPDALELGWQVNLRGPWRLVRAFVPGMVERGWGRVVNVSSGSGSFGEGLDTDHSAYAAAKAGLNALTLTLARSVPDAIKVNAMCPGWVHTRMGGAAAPRTPEEGADTAIWLATLPDDGPTGGFFRDREPIAW
jgi:NAD(P)-dependent dehydrogenase (short-subunit alcohol dehydrogenase family)